MKIVLIKKELECGSLNECCMGIFSDFKTARKEVAAYLFDEIGYYLPKNENHVVVEGNAFWETDRSCETSTCEISIADTKYTFTAYFWEDDEETSQDE